MLVPQMVLEKSLIPTMKHHCTEIALCWKNQCRILSVHLMCWGDVVHERAMAVMTFDTGDTHVPHVSSEAAFVE